MSLIAQAVVILSLLVEMAAAQTLGRNVMAVQIAEISQMKMFVTAEDAGSENSDVVLVMNVFQSVRGVTEGQIVEMEVMKLVVRLRTD